MSDTTFRIVGWKKLSQREGKLALAASVVAKKRISVAVAGSGLLALALLRLCPVFHPAVIPLRLVPAWVLFLFLPGFALLNWLLPEMVRSLVETIPLAFAASLAFWAPVIFVMLMLAVSPATLLLVALLALLVLLAAYLVLASSVDERDIHLAPAGRAFWIVWCGMIITCALMISQGGYLAGDAARFHVPILRRVVDGTRLSRGYVAGIDSAFWGARSYIFPLWHIVEALISTLAGVEPVHLWYYAPGFLVPISVLGIYLLVKALLKSVSIASLSTPVYLLAALYHRSGVPFDCWLTINYPDALNRWVLLPVILIFVVHYLRCQSSRVWILGGAVFVLSSAMGAIHASQLLFMLAWLVVFVAAYPLLIGWNGQVLTRAVGIVLVFALSLAAVFRFADAWLSPDQGWSYLETIWRSNGAWLPSVLQTGISPPCLVLGAMALSPLLLAISRRAIPFAVAFMFAGLIAPPLSRLEPHVLFVATRVIPNLNRMNSQVQFLASVLIITATIGALLPLLKRWVVQRGAILARRASTRARWVGLLEICAIGALSFWIITRWQSLEDYVLRGSFTLSPLPFFAYMAFVTFLAVWGRVRSARRGTPGIIPLTRLRYPLPTVVVTTACLASLAIPGFFWLQPFKGQPLLESDMNTEAGAARFYGTTAWDPELIGFLHDHTCEDAVIWSGSWGYSQLIPVYINRRAEWGKWADIEGIKILRQHDPTYMLCVGHSALPTNLDELICLSNAFRANGGPFEQVYESNQVTLFRVNQAPQGTAELQLNHTLAGNARLVQEKWDEAIAEYEAALSLDPGDPLAYLGLGLAYQGLGELEESIAELGDDADSEKTAERDARAYFQKAAETYRRSLALNWENAVVYKGLKETCEKLGDWCRQADVLSEVTARLEKMAASNPTDGELLLTLAHWYKAAGRYEEAVGTCLRAADLHPEDTDVYLTLGAAYLAQHKVDDAVAAYQRASELEPVQGHASLARLYEREGWMDKAIAHYMAAADAAEGPRKANLLEKAGQVYETQGQLEEAVAHYLIAAQDISDSNTMRALYRRVADMYIAAGNPKGARSLIRSVLWIKPWNAGSWSLAIDVYPALIDWYEEQGEMTRARALAWELLAIAPRHEAALRALTYYDLIANFSAAEVGAPDRVSYRLMVPSEPSVLQFRPAVNSVTWNQGGDSSTYEIYVTDEAGVQRLLFSECVGSDLEGQEWHAREMSLLPYASQEVKITFVIQPGPANFTGGEAGRATLRVMWARTGAQDFRDCSEEEISAADALKTAPGLFMALYPLD